MNEGGPPPAGGGPSPGFRYLAHTADLVVEAWGATQAEAIRQIILATASLIIDPAAVFARGCLISAVVEAGDDVAAMVKAANEYLYLLDAQGLLLADVLVAASPGATAAGGGLRLTLTFTGDTIPDGVRRYAPKSPPKAATYHDAGLTYDQARRLWTARMILDL